MALIPPMFLDAVVAVGFAGEDGKPQYQATGFFYAAFQRKVDEKANHYYTFIVTNRHVFEGETKAFLRFNPESGESAREYELPLVDASGSQLWVAHEDPDIDVAIININGQQLRDDGISFACFLSDQSVMSRSKALEAGVAEGDGVFVLGFPLGLVGKGKNFVIVRQGIVARIRDCLEANQKDFLIDCSIFPGNSGGPVVNRPEVMTIRGTKRIERAYLIGIVAAYVPYRDRAISAQTGKTRIIFEENSGLASVFPVDYIEELVAKAARRIPEPPASEVSVDSSSQNG
jgi:hypothetical protein